MKTIRLALLAIATFIGAAALSAQEAATQAFIKAIDGSATVIVPGSDQAVPAVAGQKLPEGALVTTGLDSTVVIQSHDGIDTGVASKSTVVVGKHSVSAEGLRTAVIDIKNGTTVSVLDPAKRAVNNYAVRTPKGVAAARGTVYKTTVTLSSGGTITVSVDTITGAVSFSSPAGTVVVTAGTSTTNGAATRSLVAAYASETDSTKKAELVEAVKIAVMVAEIVQDKTNSAAIRNSIDSAFGSASDSAVFGAAFDQAMTAGKQAADKANVSGPADAPTTINATVPAPGSTEPSTTVDITIGSAS